MGLTDQYLQYIPGHIFGLIGSGRCVRYVTRYNRVCKYICVPACEKVIIWDTRTAKKAWTLDPGEKSTVVAIEVQPPILGSLDNLHIAVGYGNGTIVVYNMGDNQFFKLLGHHSQVNTLAWDDRGMFLFSGSNDGEILTWDIVSERGIVRLKGHKSRVTRVRYIKKNDVLVSSGVDSFVKFWDLKTNHCFRTLLAHQTEVSDFVLLDNDSFMITSTNDAALKVWSLEFHEVRSEAARKESDDQNDKVSKFCKLASERQGITEQSETDDASCLSVKMLGSILRSKGDRVMGMHMSGGLLACHGKSSTIDLFFFLSEDNKNFGLNKKRKRLKEADGDAMLKNMVEKLAPLKASGRVAGLHIYLDNSCSVHMVVLHKNNSVSDYLIECDKNITVLKDKIKENSFNVRHLEKMGHREEPLLVDFNSVGDQVVSVSGDSVKVWNWSPPEVITSIPVVSALCLLVLPGDNHVVVGSRKGHLMLFDLLTNTLLEDVEAHGTSNEDRDAAINTLALNHDGRGFVSAGNDQLVKFWKLELVNDPQTQKRTLSFILGDNALKVADQVTCVRCSSSGKFLAVATLDMKETLYFMDSLKLCHELYGKSLPTTCMDFSDDSDLLVTGSKDSCLRIHGTDYGEIKKLLKNAHQGGVTQVRFIHKTHLFFSCGQDGFVKEWDADKFERIITLSGHSGIVRGLCVDTKGATVVTCGQDYSLRVWERTGEPLILQEEREDERAREEAEAKETFLQAPVVAGEANSEAIRPTVTTQKVEKAVDALLEVLEMYQNHLKCPDKPIVTPLSYIYNTSDPQRIVLEALRKINFTEFEEALLILPIDQVLALLTCLEALLSTGHSIELIGRTLVLLLRISMNQLIVSPKAKPVLLSLAKMLPLRIKEVQDVVGVNLAALQLMKNRLEARTEVKFFAEATDKLRMSKRRRRRAIKILPVL